jgi:hypothetical protein
MAEPPERVDDGRHVDEPGPGRHVRAASATHNASGLLGLKLRSTRSWPRRRRVPTGGCASFDRGGCRAARAPSSAAAPCNGPPARRPGSAPATPSTAVTGVAIGNQNRECTGRAARRDVPRPEPKFVTCRELYVAHSPASLPASPSACPTTTTSSIDKDSHSPTPCRAG